MNLLKVYLANPRTQSILKRSLRDKGFSLIELVVVIAVLAVLTAIALPNFLGVSEDASARTAQQAALNAFKECKVYWARGKREPRGDSNAREFVAPNVTDWVIISAVSGTITPGAITASGSGQPKTGDAGVACFEGAAGAPREVWAVPVDANKFPIYQITTGGERKCVNGKVKVGNEDTFNIGCSATRAFDDTGNWE
jgi:prepilin-type N-terminal cleavage/methylation domain-containing protein